MTQTAVSSGRGSTSSEPLAGPAMTAAVSPSRAKHRLAAGGRSSPSERKVRITGLDLARGLAVLGMIGAHLDLTENLSWSPSSWQALVYGRPAALFGVLAGVSIALLSGGIRPASGDDLVRARKRIMVRAAWVFLIGGALELLGTEIEVILGAYAVLFVLALPFLRWTPRSLLQAAGVLAVVTPPADLVLTHFVVATDAYDSPFMSLVVTGPYPALIWWTFLLVGLAVGRCDLTAARVRLRLLAAGAGLAVAGYSGGWLSTQWWAAGTPQTWVLEDTARPEGSDPVLLTGAFPHTGTTFEIAGSVGVALVVIAVCLVVADRLPRMVFPFAAVGSMALTAYAGNIVAVSVFGTLDYTTNRPWLIYVLVTTATATLWRLFLGRGPLERLLTWSSLRAAGQVAASGTTRSTRGSDVR
jgi:uncharacterized membrane protein YeiB